MDEKSEGREARVREIFAESAAAHKAAVEALKGPQDLLIERLGEMTHAERAEFADRLQEAVKHKRR